MERVSVILRTTKTRTKSVRLPFADGLSLHAINITEKKAACFFANHGGIRGKAAVFLECAVERGAKRAASGGTSGSEGRESGSVRPQHVVLPIGDHVKEQRDGYCSTPPGEVTSAAVREATQHDVEGDGGIGMEWMKADAHAVGREDGRGQEVVEIDNHGG